MAVSMCYKDKGKGQGLRLTTGRRARAPHNPVLSLLWHLPSTQVQVAGHADVPAGRNRRQASQDPL